MMSNENVVELYARTQAAIAEIKGTISQRYPSAQYDVRRSGDDPTILHLLTTVDIDDPDEVGDLVIDRVVALIAEEHIPIHVIPLRTPERILAEMQGRAVVPRRRHRVLTALKNEPDVAGASILQ